MTHQKRLMLASIAFAVLWTAAMIGATGTDTANVVIFSIAGAVIGVLWYLCHALVQHPLPPHV